MNKDAYYFPHFSNARTDRKLLRVRKELGIEGYAIYFMLLEVLRDTDGFKYPLEDIDLLAIDFDTSEQKVRTVVCNYKLFEVDENECFFSLKFNEYLEPYLKMKEQRRKAGLASAAKRMLNDRSTTVQQSKEEKSKVKESKEEESKEKRFLPPTLEMVINKMTEKLDDFTAQGEAQKFIAYYESNGWKVGENKMKSWEAAAAGWVSRMSENKNFNNGKFKNNTQTDTSRPDSILTPC